MPVRPSKPTLPKPQPRAVAAPVRASQPAGGAVRLPKPQGAPNPNPFALPTQAPAKAPERLQVLQMQANGKYKLVWMLTSKMSPAQLAAARKHPANQPGAKPLTGPGSDAEATPEPVAPRPEIDPRDGTYQAEVATAAYEQGRGVAEQNARLQQLPSLYNRGVGDVNKGYYRGSYDSNAELASRGLVQSGEYQRRGAEMQIARDRGIADIEQQYGSGARTEITNRIADINAAYQLAQDNALRSAQDRYKQYYPASSYIGAA